MRGIVDRRQRCYGDSGKQNVQIISLLLSVNSLSHASRASSLREGAFWCENAPYRLLLRPPP